MLFPIAIHKDADTSYGVTVPDIPGCFSFGDDIEDAVKNAEEAIFGHIETLLELNEDIDFHPSDIESLQDSEEFNGALWFFVKVDFDKLNDTPERVNISLPKFVLNRIDKYVKSQHETRSGFLARAALSELAHSS